MEKWPWWDFSLAEIQILFSLPGKNCVTSILYTQFYKENGSLVSCNDHDLLHLKFGRKFNSCKIIIITWNQRSVLYVKSSDEDAEKSEDKEKDEETLNQNWDYFIMQLNVCMQYKSY